ncbi:hypothetical protein G9A89_005991 [Geosiphon pyriformis]|nr:hypothetical protein G9A89_005991 [Geosiphon pyriformis]
MFPEETDDLITQTPTANVDSSDSDFSQGETSSGEIAVVEEEEEEACGGSGSGGGGSGGGGGGNETEGITPTEGTDGWGALGYMFADLLFSWLDSFPLDNTHTSINGEQATNSSKPHPNNKNTSIIDIPLQFIDLLTYPDVDPNASKKASFAVLREISFVKQRRQVLFGLSLSMLIVRLCSWDLFFVLLFAANCGMLFLMKNSGKVNVTMAKRAVRQRIVWAKQWAGSFLRKKATSSSNPNSNNHLSPSPSSTSKTRGFDGRVNPTTPTLIIEKIVSQAPIQSGSLSDTTHGGSVTSKLSNRRRKFFRKTNHGSSTGASKAVNVPNSSSETASLATLYQNGSKTSISSLGTMNGLLLASPTLNGTSNNYTNLSMTSEPAQLSAHLNVEKHTSSSSSISKRRFFKGRSNTNNNASLTSSSAPPTLPEIPKFSSLNSSNTTFISQPFDFRVMAPSSPSTHESNININASGSEELLPNNKIFQSVKSWPINAKAHMMDELRLKQHQGFPLSKSQRHRKNLSASAPITNYLTELPD